MIYKLQRRIQRIEDIDADFKINPLWLKLKNEQTNYYLRETKFKIYELEKIVNKSDYEKKLLEKCKISLKDQEEIINGKT